MPHLGVKGRASPAVATFIGKGTFVAGQLRGEAVACHCGLVSGFAHKCDFIITAGDVCDGSMAKAIEVIDGHSPPGVVVIADGIETGDIRLCATDDHRGAVTLDGRTCTGGHAVPNYH